MAYQSFTYSALKAALQDWLEDDYADFETALATIIGQAELRCLRDLDLTIFDTTDTTITTVAGASALNKPANTITVEWLRVSANQLDLKPLDWIEDYLVDADQAVPRYYAEVSDTAIKLAPIPDQIYPVSYRVNIRPLGLSDANQTTWLSTNAGDLLFAATLVEAERFVRDFKAADEWDQKEYLPLLGNARSEFRDLVRRRQRPLMAQPQALPGPHNRSSA